MGIASGKRFLRCSGILLMAVAPGAAVEHPGVLANDVECVSCHTNKQTGKSVHSVMVASCGVCHVTMTQGDMTTVSLSMPKQKICSACHDQASALHQHVPGTKGACVECHDAHSSNLRMLLLESAVVSRPKKR